MKNRTLENEVINYYSGQRLAPGKLESILQETQEIRSRDALQEKQQPQNDLKGSGFINRVAVGIQNSKRWLILPMAGAMSAFFVLWFVQSGLLFSGDNKQHELSNILFKEAAVNHLVKSDLDYKENDLEKLNDSMTRLDFDLQLPADLVDSYELVGGRYCTVGGNLAVHLRLVATDAQAQVTESVIRSVFVTRKTDALARLRTIGSSGGEFQGQVTVNSRQKGDLFMLVAQGN